MVHAQEGQPLDALAVELRALDGRAYRSYKALQGRVFRSDPWTLRLDHVQGDPFADPSRLRATATPDGAGLPAFSRHAPTARRATADFLHRRLAASLDAGTERLGTGRGGQLATPPPVAEVLARSAVTVTEEGAVELRFRVGLPARGRRILGAAAARLLCETVPRALARVLPLPAEDASSLRRHVETVEDAVALRALLPSSGLVGFVADASVLPRRSGVDDAPMDRGLAVPFRSPPGLRVTLEAPHAGPLTGLGVPAGVTLIVGGGYHGKSTLLRALERGVYDHVAGDGRERVVTIPGAIKVRAEDRRAIRDTDISNFIRGLPTGADTGSFTSEDASGSTSQAAAIAEALEAGSPCVLIDEDTSATNFMIRDARMRRLVADADEPIVPFIDRARQLFDEAGTSSVLVVGGSGDYFDVADTVISMTRYEPRDAGEEAHRIAASDPSPRHSPPPWRPVVPHTVSRPALAPLRDARIRIPSRDRLLVGSREVSLAALDQLVDRSQTRAIGLALRRLARDSAGPAVTIGAAVDRLLRAIARDGLDALEEFPTGDLAEFRAEELIAAYHRLRL